MVNAGNFAKVISGPFNQPHRISPWINNRCNFNSTTNCFTQFSISSTALWNILPGFYTRTETINLKDDCCITNFEAGDIMGLSDKSTAMLFTVYSPNNRLYTIVILCCTVWVAAV
jgi:hypothetical protein